MDRAFEQGLFILISGFEDVLALGVGWPAGSTDLPLRKLAEQHPTSPSPRAGEVMAEHTSMPRCSGTLKVMPVSDEELTASTYDTIADAYAKHIVGLDAEQSIDVAMIDLFTTLVRPPCQVLDAGCGAGRMLPHLAMKGCNVEGIDLSEGMIARAQLANPEFRLQVGSLTNLPYPAASFDGVFSWYSTIHNPDEDLDVMIDEMVRVLRPGGLRLIAFQTGQGLRQVGKGFQALGYDIVLNRWHREPDAMGSVLEHHGLSVVARMEREALGTEADGQAVLIARLMD